jgi:uncharacterized protein YqhQ
VQIGAIPWSAFLFILERKKGVGHVKECNIGGQAVLEGVMMKAPCRMAIAVRRHDGEIVVDSRQLVSLKDRHPALKWPVIRGIITFGETLVLGVKTLMDSAEMCGDEDVQEEYKPSKLESFIANKTGKKVEDVMIFFALVLALGLAVLLFVVSPALLAGFLRKWISNGFVLGLIEGIIRLLIFICYLVLVTRVKDIQRVFEYHGAEHKTIHCYEHGEELCVDNARKYTTLHPRCGTAFLLVVMVMGILVFSLLSWENIALRIGIKILLLPLVAGLSYEIIKWAGKSQWSGMKVVLFPGLMLQKLTTREPDDKQLEVAIRAFMEATGTVQEVKDAIQGNGDPKEGAYDASEKQDLGTSARGRDAYGPHVKVSET